MKKTFVLKNHDVKDFCIRTIHGLGVDPDRPLQVKISPYRRNRTLEQNSLLHGLFDQIADYSGYTPEEVKELLVRQLAGTVTTEIMGHTVTRRRSTSKMKVDELSDLIERVYQWAAEKGVPL